MTPNDFVFKIKADFLSALANPARLRIIEILKDGEATVGAISASLQLPQPSVSKHLAILRQANIVGARQEKASVYYSIRDRDIYKVLKPVTQMLKKNLRDSQAALAHLG